MADTLTRRDAIDLEDDINRNLRNARAILIVISNNWHGDEQTGEYSTPTHFIYDALAQVELLLADVLTFQSQIDASFETIWKPKPPREARAGVGTPRPGA